MRTIARFAGLAVLASATLFSGGLAQAGPGGDTAARAARPVLICATDAATRRAFMREYGSAPVFVTAREVLSVRTSDPAWRTPRCMTAREHARYLEAATTYAAAR